MHFDLYSMFMLSKWWRHQWAGDNKVYKVLASSSMSIVVVDFVPQEQDHTNAAECRREEDFDGGSLLFCKFSGKTQMKVRRIFDE